jgi:hypothetical protein
MYRCRVNRYKKSLIAIHLTDNLIVIEDRDEESVIFFDVFQQDDKIYLQEFITPQLNSNN